MSIDQAFKIRGQLSGFPLSDDAAAPRNMIQLSRIAYKQLSQVERVTEGFYQKSEYLICSFFSFAHCHVFRKPVAFE